MSRYDPNSMTRVLNLEKYDFRNKPSECHTDSEDEDESINGIFKTGIQVGQGGSNTSKKQPGGFIKRLGLGRRDREKDARMDESSASHASADFAAGSVNSDSKLRSSVETNSDDTFITTGTALTGDHLNFLLKAHKEMNGSDHEGGKDEDDKSNEGVEDYWKATEPGRVIRDSTKVPIPVDEDDEEVPITERIAKNKAERRNTSCSMQTAPFDGNLDLSNDGRLDADIEDDLMKYSAAIEKEFIPTKELISTAEGSIAGGGDKRPVFVKPATYSDEGSTAITEKAGNRAVDFSDDDEENGFKYSRKSSLTKLKEFFAGGGNLSSAAATETYDLRGSDPVAQAAINARKEKKKKKGWSRRASDGTTDSTWSWSQPEVNFNFTRRTSDQSNDGSNSTPNAHTADYSPEDEEKSHTSSVGTFDRSWLGLGGLPQSNGRGGAGRGGASWRDVRRMTLTPFVDFDGDSFHSQRNTPYRPGTRILKRCISVLFVLAVVVLAGALIAFNIPSNDYSDGEAMMTKGTLTPTLTDEEQLDLKNNVNESCSNTSVQSASGRHKCQSICHNHFCCFDTDEDGYNCQSDKDKYCMLFSGCAILLGDLISGVQASTPVEIEHVGSNTLSSRVKNACSNVQSSFGKLGCQKVCEEHMCCVEKDASKSCKGNAKKNCAAYEACSALSGNVVTQSNTANTVGDKIQSSVEPDLPSWDNAQKEEDVMTVSTANNVDVVTSSSGSIEDTVISTEGVAAKEVDAACQNLATIRGRKQCNKLCEDHMCCFEIDESKGCLADKDCSVYGSCVFLTALDPNITLTNGAEDEDGTTKNVDDTFGYTDDDDMFIVDTEAVDEDPYDSTVFHVGNRTVVGVENSELSPNEDNLEADWSLEEELDDQSSLDDDIYVVDTEDIEYDEYDSTVYHLDVRGLRG